MLGSFQNREYPTIRSQQSAPEWNTQTNDKEQSMSLALRARTVYYASLALVDMVELLGRLQNNEPHDILYQTRISAMYEILIGLNCCIMSGSSKY